MWLVQPLVARRAFSLISLADALALLSLDAKNERLSASNISQKGMSHIRDLVPMLAMQIAHNGARSSLLLLTEGLLLITSPVTRLHLSHAGSESCTGRGLKIPAKMRLTRAAKHQMGNPELMSKNRGQTHSNVA